MDKNIELAKELHEYTKVIGSHNLHIQDVASELVNNLTVNSLVEEPKLSPVEDVGYWINDNFCMIESHINKTCRKNISDVVLADSISEEVGSELKTGLLNIVGTYKSFN